MFDPNKPVQTRDGRKAHRCPDWDFDIIDETMPEFECCTCGLINIEEGEG